MKDLSRIGTPASGVPFHMSKRAFLSIFANQLLIPGAIALLLRPFG